MIDWNNEDFIRGILHKLENGSRLSEVEFAAVNTALRKEKGYKQEPYYEVVFHDEYDRTQHRIMNPEYHNEDFVDGRKEIRDVFTVDFVRFE